MGLEHLKTCKYTWACSLALPAFLGAFAGLAAGSSSDPKRSNSSSSAFGAGLGAGAYKKRKLNFVTKQGFCIVNVPFSW